MLSIRVQKVVSDEKRYKLCVAVMEEALRGRVQMYCSM